MQGIRGVGEHLLGLIEPALAALERGGPDRDLAEVLQLLHGLLMDLLRVLERDPGVEAAVADLHTAASTIVRDNRLDNVPCARKVRLFREAQLRFRARLSVAQTSELGTKILWRHQELLCA